MRDGPFPLKTMLWTHCVCFASLVAVGGVSGCAESAAPSSAEHAAFWDDTTLEPVGDADAEVAQSVALVTSTRHVQCDEGTCRVQVGREGFGSLLLLSRVYDHLLKAGIDTRTCPADIGAKLSPPIPPLLYEQALVDGNGSGVIVDGGELRRRIESMQAPTHESLGQVRRKIAEHYGKASAAQLTRLLDTIDNQALLLTAGHTVAGAVTNDGKCDALALIRGRTTSELEFSQQNYARCKHAYRIWDKNVDGHDAAILVLDRPEWRRHAIDLPQDPNLALPMTIRSFGHPVGHRQTVSRGRLLHEYHGRKVPAGAWGLFGMFSAIIGQSGGPLVDGRGELVAIATRQAGISSYSNRLCYQTLDENGDPLAGCHLPIKKDHIDHATVALMSCEANEDPQALCIGSGFMAATEGSARRLHKGCWRPAVLSAAQHASLLAYSRDESARPVLDWMSGATDYQLFLFFAESIFPQQNPEAPLEVSAPSSCR